MSTDNATGDEEQDTSLASESSEKPFQDRIPEAVSTHLEAIDRLGYSRYQVFTDFLDLMLYALQGRDDPYLDVMERYQKHNESVDSGERPADHFAKGFGELRTRTEALEMDIIGDVYMQYGCNNDHFGQYFTPHSLAVMMRELTGTVSEQDLEEATPAEPVTVADPACGSGRLLVDIADPEAPVTYHGWDIDADCAKMFALNLWLTGLSGTVVHGNSLTRESHRFWTVQNPPIGPPLLRESSAD
jgi:type I restriction-modification system DNA methylase subunit